MKKYIVLSFFMISQTVLRSQDVLNPYLNTQIISPGLVQMYPTTWVDPTNGPISFSWVDNGILNGYSGEYEIFLNRHPWHPLTNPNTGMQLSIGMEIVSFPFSPQCAFDINGCVSPVNERKLFMPDASINYDFQNESWGLLSNKLPFPRTLVNNVDQTLVSAAFAKSTAIGAGPNNKVLPHTIIKHTVYVHCGPNTNILPLPPVVYSFSWIYDNTRGRMRYYPPCNCNCNTGINACNELDWDICFAPELLTRYEEHYYNEADNSIILPNGTIDYFKFADLQNYGGCNQYNLTILPNSGDNYLSFGTYTKVFFPPYALLSAPALQHRGNNIAGYTSNIIGGLEAIGGIQHQYFIDRNLDISVINTGNKEIYNPSEVTFTASANDFVFPSGYTFKTIRGVYPTPAEVSDDDLPENGGPFADDRLVPVRTDLRCENLNYPHDPLDLSHSVYASIYKLESLSRLTVQPCVKIFDAAFDVQQGGTLIFEDYPSTMNPDRFKLIGNGGVIAKNLSPYQFLQNTIVTQTQPINYTAFAAIYAGANVDQTIPNNPYIINPGADVKFVSEGEIILQDGFDVLDGASFDAFIDVLGIPQPCDPPPPSNQNRIIGQNGLATSSDPLNIGVRVYPNPGTGVFTVEISGKPVNSTWTIKNIHNHTIASGSSLLSKFDFNLESAQSGIYILEVQSENTTQFARVVKQ